MADYRLSVRAETDLENIATFGIEQFGAGQARRYLDGLYRRFSRIAEMPLLYPAVDDIRAGYRRSVFESHSIYYQIEGDGVFIVRILGREDIETGLPD